MYCLTYYPNIFKYVPRYVVDYILIKNRLIDIDNKSYDFCRFLLDVKYVDDLILSFWNHNITKINKWYKEQMKSNDLIITGSPDFLMNPICEYLNIESLSSVVDKNTGIVTMFCYRENKATVLEKNILIKFLILFIQIIFMMIGLYLIVLIQFILLKER